MMAGILLGPSLFGLLAPNIFQFVFAASTLEPLRLLSQVGVCLFMFAVGLESDWTELKTKASTAVLIGHAGIAVPTLLGVGLAFLFYDSLAQPGARFIDFALFVAISISVTAFPVLVRILQDRKILTTPLGQFAAACAAVGDATAWALLALIVALPKSADFRSAGVCLFLALLFVIVMFGLVRPSLPKLLRREALERAKLPKGTLAVVVCFVLISALTTQLLGIHALFGAFLAGLVMPNVGSFREKLVTRVENLSSVFLLPVFFAFSGLRTQVGLLQNGTDWAICLLIIAVAITGKLGGTVITARFEGMNWRDSLQLGALMNTRGLMELIALNLGYELHILSQRLFSMLVIMALVTTMMTGPLLSLFQERPKSA
jgi:Kef-type K+ transport system membrane component KefB